MKIKLSDQKDFPLDARHLGGHGFITHLDLGILEFFKKEFNCQSFLDIGCGPGGMVKLAKDLGYTSYGIDGDYSLDRDVEIIIHDFSKGKVNHTIDYDLGYSCEFVEHVDKIFVPNFMESFSRCVHVVMTFAPLGAKGHHHVNCNTKEYWIDIFKEYNLIFNEEITNRLKEKSTMKRDFFRNNGLYFRNTNIKI